MKMRPVDEVGDVLPVFSAGEMVYGPQAVALLVEDRLNLLTGEWWENRGIGFSVLERLRDSRLTEADASALASMITAYIRETPEVLNVEEVVFTVAGLQFSYSCTVRTTEGIAAVGEVRFFL